MDCISWLHQERLIKTLIFSCGLTGFMCTFQSFLDYIWISVLTSRLIFLFCSALNDGLACMTFHLYYVLKYLIKKMHLNIYVT